MKMWSGRFSGGLNKEFEQWQRSYPFDQRLLRHEISASSAYARALHGAGVLSADELDTLLRGLRAIGEEAMSPPEMMADDEAEDVHHFVEKQLAARVGDVAYKLHSGRSRNEQIATDLRLYVLERARDLQGLLRELMLIFVERAEAAGASAMPAYTHMQRAEPVLVAHWLLTYFEMLARDADRIAACAARANECPLGSGAITGSTVSLDRAAIARELGFAKPTENSMDATSDRDFAIEFVNVLAQFSTHLSRWAEEFILFSTQEFGFVMLPESFSTGSSAMPQKKNPDALELVRAKAARLMGCSVALMANVKSQPLAYNKDMQDTQEPLYEATETAVALAGIVAGFMRDVGFDFAKMQEASESSYMNAFAAASYLVSKGVPFRLAHERIGKAVRAATVKGCRLEDLTLEELQAFSPEFAQDFYAAASLLQVLELHDVPGGTAPSRVREALQAAKKRVHAPREAHVAGA